MMQNFGRIVWAATITLIVLVSFHSLNPAPPLLRDVGPGFNSDDCEWGMIGTIRTCKTQWLPICDEYEKENALRDPIAYCKKLVGEGYLSPGSGVRP